jgi:ketosteroid isomerase-like protein
MGLSKEEVERLLKTVEEELESQLKAKDATRVAALYHEDAVLIHKGGKASYGREGDFSQLSNLVFAEIAKAYEPFFQGNSEFDGQKTYASASDDGEYLVRRGTFNVVGSDKKFPYEQIFKKAGDKYLILYDIFEFQA